jgi:hypothetical protein
MRRQAPQPEEALAAPIETLGGDIRTWLRARFPDVPPDVRLVWREGRHHCGHRVGVIQTPRRRRGASS